MTQADRNIEALLSEERVFEPPEDLVSRAVVQDPSIYARAEADPEGFWAEQADRLAWFRRWDQVMDWSPPASTIGGRFTCGGGRSLSVICNTPLPLMNR